MGGFVKREREKGPQKIRGERGNLTKKSRQRAGVGINLWVR